MPSSPTARDAAEGLADTFSYLARETGCTHWTRSRRSAEAALGRWAAENRAEIEAALRSAGTEGGETQGAVEMREAAKIACLDLADVYREAGENHIRNGAAVKARQALDWADGAMMCAHAVAKLSTRTTDGGEA